MKEEVELINLNKLAGMVADILRPEINEMKDLLKRVVDEKEDQFITMADAIKKTGLSRSTIYDRVKADKLTKYKDGGIVKFSLKELMGLSEPV